MNVFKNIFEQLHKVNIYLYLSMIYICVLSAALHISLSAYDRRTQVMTCHGDLPWGYFCCRSVEVQKIFMMHIIYVLSAVLHITITVYGNHH